jgi:hypothetical protein
MKQCAGRKSRKRRLTEEWRRYLASLPAGPERDHKLKMQAFLEEVVAEALKSLCEKEGL